MTASIAVSNILGVQLKAAERVEFHFEGMTIPIPIDELNLWKDDINDKNVDELLVGSEDNDLFFWLNLLGFESREALSNFLETPLIKDKSMARQLMRSWAGKKLLDEISDLVTLDQDRTGTKVFNTLENLLENQEQVSLIDLLKELPAEVIHFDLDGWVEVISTWRDELKKQQKLLLDLRRLSNKTKLVELENFSNTGLKETLKETMKVTVEHRYEPLLIQVWKPVSRSTTRSNWIVFMPGLGGDPNHFEWLARSLSHQGWEVVVIDHPGSNAKAMYSLVLGRDPLPGSAEVFSYRLSDLKAVINAKEKGLLNIKGENIVLMGHSLGALISFMASGASPQIGLAERCDYVLNNLSITNLSRILQCQVLNIPLPNPPRIDNLDAIVGINSFGNLLWPDFSSLKINVPVFLTGGTFDLITPAITEQLGLLLSTRKNNFSRALIIEGASHFSPIRVQDKLEKAIENDLYQLSDALVGTHPFSVQSLLASEIIRFLDNLEKGKELNVSTNNATTKLIFHVLDQSTTSKILNN
ncbi:alpha/beta hydrolase [Prochlorococcus marinus]|uniref:alpha/beta hydrolase n=1 Tax=Prochlorococcus marinus TaxID=1219 RepID=UPI0022B588E9|nr:alpha/beta hydrolase [Prochlorococcus marinus]